MLFAAVILVSVDGEHDGLEQSINLRHRHETAQMRNVSRLRLQQKEQIAISLSLLVVWKRSLRKLCGNI